MSDDPTRNLEDLAPSPTQDIADWAAGCQADQIDADTLRWARHCVLDWLGVTTAARDEPLVDLLVQEALSDGAAGTIPLAGRAEALAPSWAILVNGAASHALDYDDVNRAMHGHTTVAVLPAVLTAGIAEGRSFHDILCAFVVGYEVACLVGAMTGDGHYDTGWHATATIGTFGAAAGTAWLLGLDRHQTAHALGTAATMAAGLKSMFGTMSKPLHAGRAAQSGYLAARMAARGWVSRDDALECPQGFWATQAPDHVAFPVASRDNQAFQIHDNLFKYHAACYLTHSSIEACKTLREAHGLTPDQVKRVRLRVGEGHLKVCNIAQPATGLEVKFSLTHTAAMAIAGVDTSAIDNYSDAVAQREDLMALAGKVEVEAVAVAQTMTTQADVIIETEGGATLTNLFDVGKPATDTDAQETRLSAKFDALVAPILGATRCEDLRAAVLTGDPDPLDLLHASQPA